MLFFIHTVSRRIFSPFFQTQYFDNDILELHTIILITYSENEDGIYFTIQQIVTMFINSFIAQSFSFLRNTFVRLFRFF